MPSEVLPPSQDMAMEIDLVESDEDKPKMNGLSNLKLIKADIANLEIILQNTKEDNIDVDSLLSSCKIAVCENVKTNIKPYVQDIDITLKNTSSIIRQTELCIQQLASFISSSNLKTPFPQVKNHHPERLKTKLVNGDVHHKVVHNSISNSSLQKAQTPQVEGLEILSTIPPALKINLPPVGELVRSPLVTGLKVWIMKHTLLNVWIKATIAGTRESQNGADTEYKVRLDSTRCVHPKWFNAKYMAYDSPTTVIIPVGTRIIARYTDPAGRSAHYAGIVAEPPKVTNEKRYLIFYDDGCAQYVKHEDVYVVCAQSVDVADDVHSNISDFVRGYLQKFPERPMVKLQKDQRVQTEYNCEWSEAKVLEVDCSMVKMLFLKSLRIEWIYRGSTRLKPLCNELANAESHRLEGKHRRRHAAPRQPHQPYVEYTREEEIVVIDSDSEGENKQDVTSENDKPSVNDKPRNTARKSLGGRQISTMYHNQKVSSIFRVSDKKSHLGYKELSHIKSFVRIKYVNHDCGVHCREKDDPARHKGKNPLLIPIFLGWERQLRRFRASGPGPRIIVTYRSPCGRHLKSLHDVLKYLTLVKSRLTIDFFSYNTDISLFRTFRPKEVLYSNNDITNGKENVPVSCVNSLCEEPPPFVEYSAERFPGENVFLNLDSEFLFGCECKDNCQNAATCACQQLTSYAKGGGEGGYKFRRLTDQLSTGIYECNPRCSCNFQCGNKVVQNGMAVRLQMFKTQYKGWGIRCLDDIDAGQFICVYAGQLLTEQGADADGKECGDEYLAELDFIEVVEKMKEGYESDVPEFAMEVDEEEEEEEKVKTEKEDNVISSDDQYDTSDSDILYADSDSEFESSLRSTAISTYATRSRQKRSKSSHSTSNDNVVSEDSNSCLDGDKKDIKDLPDISYYRDTFQISIRPLSPTLAEELDKTELKRKPKISEKIEPMSVSDIEAPSTIESPMDVTKCEPLSESENADEKAVFIKSEPETEFKNFNEKSDDVKCEPVSESQSVIETSNDINSSSQKVVAKKSVSMQNPISVSPKKEWKYRSVRTYFGEDSLYIMDAKTKGNIGRYLNHSCEPNVFVQNVFVDTHDLRFPAVAFFANNPIHAGTELTWDYNYEVGSVAEKVMYCYCEAPSCRGRLL